MRTTSQVITLADLNIDDQGVVCYLDCSSLDSGGQTLRNKLLMMGFVQGTAVRITKVAPLGDPIGINILGSELSLRRSEARCIFINPAISISEAEPVRLSA